MKDYYIILGVSRTSTREEIRKQYKILVKEHHPDLNPDRSAEAEERIKIINEAYSVLSDPAKRREHDAYLTRCEAWERVRKEKGKRRKTRRHTKQRETSGKKANNPFAYAAAFFVVTTVIVGIATLMNNGGSNPDA